MCQITQYTLFSVINIYTQVFAKKTLLKVSCSEQKWHLEKRADAVVQAISMLIRDVLFLDKKLLIFNFVNWGTIGENRELLAKVTPNTDQQFLGWVQTSWRLRWSLGSHTVRTRQIWEWYQSCPLTLSKKENKHILPNVCRCYSQHRIDLYWKQVGPQRQIRA